ncbi:collagen alpha-1(I) chain-like [Choloepus didactylus]|uniref:collagen alpha-1(I) chain-like n=1 Tax=Choloepus didactylus TaxID=27675 RepID=UPI0018A0E35E|nr:collagen alpha-1(I) chain-like [Choloepus didactylus]
MWRHTCTQDTWTQTQEQSCTWTCQVHLHTTPRCVYRSHGCMCTAEEVPGSVCCQHDCLEPRVAETCPRARPPSPGPRSSKEEDVEQQSPLSPLSPLSGAGARCRVLPAERLQRAGGSHGSRHPPAPCGFPGVPAPFVEDSILSPLSGLVTLVENQPDPPFPHGETRGVSEVPAGPPQVKGGGSSVSLWGLHHPMWDPGTTGAAGCVWGRGSVEWLLLGLRGAGGPGTPDTGPGLPRGSFWAGLSWGGHVPQSFASSKGWLRVTCPSLQPWGLHPAEL